MYLVLARCWGVAVELVYDDGVGDVLHSDVLIADCTHVAGSSLPRLDSEAVGGAPEVRLVHHHRLHYPRRVVLPQAADAASFHTTSQLTYIISMHASLSLSL